MNNSIESLEEALRNKEAEASRYRQQYYALLSQRDELRRELAEAQSDYYTILSTKSWKITAPLRFLLNSRAQADTAHRFWRMNSSPPTKPNDFAENIKFSILIPLCNTPKTSLKNMLDSVANQTYRNWELCLTDASDPGHKYIGKICKWMSIKHRGKIKFRRLSSNPGISGSIDECINISTGDYIALASQEDALHPSALFECARAIFEKNADFVYTDECKFKEYKKDASDAFYKPDFAPDTLRGSNYIGRFCVFSRHLLGELGDSYYDLVLRLTEQAKCIVHIPGIFYYRRTRPESTASESAEIKALSEHLERVGMGGTVLPVGVSGYYRIKYKLDGLPKISVIIPNRDNVNILRRCLDSIFDKTTYSDYEVMIVENNSRRKETFDCYKSLESNDKVKLLTWENNFNFAGINNYAVSKASGEYVVLLNNDTEIITGNWLEELLMFAQRDDVGAVGAMLYYPDDTIQHAGVILGMHGAAGHAHYMDGSRRGDFGYNGRLLTAQNQSCVTAACMMLPKKVFHQVGGMNESLAVAFNDTDLCLRIRAAGYLVVWTPYAELYHHESISRGYDETPEKLKLWQEEESLFQEIWANEIAAGDPYYNVNLPLTRRDFKI